MAFLQHANHMLLCDVGVALGRSYGGVPEELLHHPYVDPVPEQERSHRVPQHMRGDMTPYPRLTT